MLESTQEVLVELDRLLDDGDRESTGKLLVPLDRTSLRALLIHVLRERGAAVADAVAVAYLDATADSRAPECRLALTTHTATGAREGRRKDRARGSFGFQDSGAANVGSEMGGCLNPSGEAQHV